MTDLGLVVELTILVLAIFLGFEVISKVPTMLHTPLMSGSNFIHGIVIVGAIVVLGRADDGFTKAVGFVAMAPATDDDLDTGDTPPPGDIPPATATVVVSPLLVEPRWGRRGHGSRLLAAAVDLAREDGAVRALAWVLEADTASRGLFASAGWEADGVARILDTGPTTLRELRLHADITP